MATRLGQVLVDRGVMSEAEVEAVLDRQQTSHRPFGALAEEMFGVCPATVEDAWAHQYEQIAERIDPADEKIEKSVLALIDRRQAWQFRIIPMRREGGEIRVATTREHLLRAMRFALRHFGQACYFVLTGPDELAASLDRHYPMPGMDASTVRAKEPLRSKAG